MMYVEEGYLSVVLEHLPWTLFALRFGVKTAFTLAAVGTPVFWYDIFTVGTIFSACLKTVIRSD